MRKYEVLEDNAGGLTLAVFDNYGKVNYLHGGYEYLERGSLLKDLEELKNGADPANDWEGNEENPQEIYDNMVSFEHCVEIVADNNEIYPDKMGIAASLEFGIDK